MDSLSTCFKDRQMPIGNSVAVPYVVQHLMKRGPQRVLDLGIGFGMYGAVVRQWLDRGVRPWRTHLTGVEVFADYRNPTWDLYDEVFVGTIDEFLKSATGKFDCVILADVIEHFEKPTGRDLLKTLRPIVPPTGSLVVVTPAIFREQAAVHGNAYEIHRSGWRPDDFRQCGCNVILDGTEQPGFEPTLLATWEHDTNIGR